MVKYDTITIHYGQKFYLIIIGQPYCPQNECVPDQTLWTVPHIFCDFHYDLPHFLCHNHSFTPKFRIFYV
jgi:hypothetical protein